MAVLAFAAAANAQLVQKAAPTKADSVDLTGKRPMVYSKKPGASDKAAEATAEMDGRNLQGDSTVGTLIGVGAEFVGQTMKNMISPNSAEADAVELERQRR